MLIALDPGSPFPEISPDSTDVWVDFWNIVWKSWIEDAVSGSSGSSSGWPISFTRNGRIIESEGDGLEAQLPPSPSLAIVLPAGSKWIIGGVYYEIDADTIIGEITPNYVGWIAVTATFNAEFETIEWGYTLYASRPTLGTGVVGKITTIGDRVSVLDASEEESDTIPTLPLILARLRASVDVGSGEGGGGGTSVVYLSQLKYSASDPRNAITVLDEKFANLTSTILGLIEAGGSREGPSDTDQLWEMVLGLVRIVRDLNPQSLRFLNVGSARPGIYGTESAGDTEVFDLGGTLPEVDRTYDAR